MLLAAGWGGAGCSPRPNPCARARAVLECVLTPPPCARLRAAWWVHPTADFVAGIVGGFAGKSIEYPFDTVKVRLQVNPALGGPWECFKNTIRNEGFFHGLYRGLAAPMAGTVLETAVLFSANGRIKRALAGPGESVDHLPLPKVYAAGGLTGIVVATVLTPVELVKVRMQTLGLSNESMTTMGMIRHSVREEGLSVLYRGHVGTLLREIPGTAGWFGAYETLLRMLTPPGVAREALPGWKVVLAGALGGTVYWSAMYPADTIKSAMQNARAGEARGFLDTGRSIFARGGLRGLYAGLVPTLLRAAPANAAVFLAYEWTASHVRQLLHQPISSTARV